MKQMKEDMSKHKEAFDKLDRYEEIRSALLADFAEYDYLIQVEEFVYHLEIALDGLKKAMHGALECLGESEGLKFYRQTKFFYHTIFSTQLSFECFLYESSKTLVDPAGFHQVIDLWKKSEGVSLVKTLRNRIQHGAMLEGCLKVDVRTEHHELGRHESAIYHLDESIWDKTSNELNAQNRSYYEATVKPQEDRLLYLANEYNLLTKNLRENLGKQFQKSYPKQMSQMEALVEESKSIDEWFRNSNLN